MLSRPMTIGGGRLGFLAKLTSARGAEKRFRFSNLRRHSSSRVRSQGWRFEIERVGEPPAR